MRIVFGILLSLAVVGAALAQTAHIDEWVTSILDNRANKKWRPSVHASPDVVKKYPKLGGKNVVEDKKLPPRTVEIRTLDDVDHPDRNGEAKGRKTKTGSPVATYNGVE